MTPLNKSIIRCLFFSLLLFSSCKWRNRAKGTAIGTGSGAAVGGVIGKKAGNTAAGVIIGAAVGGTAGYLIGRHMDKQAAEIRNDIAGANVERVGEGILITFNSSLMFDVNSYGLRTSTRNDLAKLSNILNKYNDTDILIRGHTDSTGSEDHNFDLSEKRAKSVRNQLSQNGVTSSRFTIEGYGEALPIADNASDSGRQRNRRVEVAIYANKKLKKAAKKGKLEE